MDISKKDWKIFREKLPGWQEIIYDNLADFSDEFKQEVKRILELKKGFDC